MSRFQRMVVVPESEYIQLTTLQQVKQPLAQKFHEVSNEHENAAAIGDPYARLVARSTTLDEMKGLRDQMREYLSITTPKPYRSRAERLLSVLEPRLKWNEKGELLDEGTNKAISQSQVSDLIQHAVRDRRRHNFSPTGWNYFVQRLHEHNVPQMLLNLSTLEELKSKSSKVSKPLVDETSVSRIKDKATVDEAIFRLKKRAKRIFPTVVREKSTRLHTLPDKVKDYFPFKTEK